MPDRQGFYKTVGGQILPITVRLSPGRGLDQIENVSIAVIGRVE